MTSAKFFSFLVSAFAALLHAQQPSAQVGEPQYSYLPGRWSSCSRTCGAGIRKRVVKCVQQIDSEQIEVSFDLCTQSLGEENRPKVAEICNRVQCPVEVQFLPGKCKCGDRFKSWTRRCVRFTEAGTYVPLDDRKCSGVVAIPPAHKIPCQKSVPCHPRYDVGEWRACSVSCGQGTQSRQVRCVQRANGETKILPKDICRKNGAVIPEVRSCQKESCPEGFVYQTSKWSACSVRCLRERKVRCFSRKDNTYVADEKCALLSEPRPAEVERCSNNAGRLVWTAGKWGKCSKCTQQRTVSCTDVSTGLKANSCPLCTKPSDVRACPCPEEPGIIRECTDVAYCRMLRDDQAIASTCWTSPTMQKQCCITCKELRQGNDASQE